jgi:methylated-DNA-[protein]-cysteine S-methyltransferase
MLTAPNQPFDIGPIYYTVEPGPWGLMGLAASNKGLIHIQSVTPSEKAYVNFLKRSFVDAPQKDSKQLKPATDQLRLYLKGKLKNFDVPIDFITGTTFQKQVWKKLASIPYGETRSYAWLARSVKRPNAHRAVGNANGKNPLSILLPCHRVVQSNGNLGGYSGGLHIKRYLLELEKTGRASL